MAKTRIGIDVGSTAVRVAEVAAGDVPVVVRAAQVPLAPGVVEAGEVRQPEAVAEALREVWSKSGVKTKQVFLGVGNQRVIVRDVDPDQGAASILTHGWEWITTTLGYNRGARVAPRSFDEITQVLESEGLTVSRELCSARGMSNVLLVARR